MIVKRCISNTIIVTLGCRHACITASIEIHCVPGKAENLGDTNCCSEQRASGSLAIWLSNQEFKGYSRWQETPLEDQVIMAEVNVQWQADLIICNVFSPITVLLSTSL